MYPSTTETVDQKQAVRILQFTDPHLFADANGELKEVNTFASLQAVVKHARVRSRSPHLTLLTGDLAQDKSERAYQRLRQVFADSDSPVGCLPGNHDDKTRMRELLGNPPFQYCGGFRLADWRIVLLDTSVPGMVGGRLDETELSILENTLNTMDERFALICVHHQPIPIGSRWLDAIGLENSEAFLDVIKPFESVRGVLWGHVHQEFDKTVDGVRFMSSPSTCAQFMPNTRDFTLDTADPGYRWLELSADGGIDTGVVRVTCS